MAAMAFIPEAVRGIRLRELLDVALVILSATLKFFQQKLAHSPPAASIRTCPPPAAPILARSTSIRPYTLTEVEPFMNNETAHLFGIAIAAENFTHDVTPKKQVIAGNIFTSVPAGNFLHVQLCIEKLIPAAGFKQPHLLIIIHGAGSAGNVQLQIPDNRK
ncbi:MAG: hypothetical protein Q9209_007613 [Squamulea sp. 1 TL-2023]